MVKSGIVRSHRGAQGGITLARPAEAISLMDIMQACQGQLVGDFCTDTCVVAPGCHPQVKVQLGFSTNPIFYGWVSVPGRSSSNSFRPITLRCAARSDPITAMGSGCCRSRLLPSSISLWHE